MTHRATEPSAATRAAHWASLRALIDSPVIHGMAVEFITDVAASGGDPRIQLPAYLVYLGTHEEESRRLAAHFKIDNPGVPVCCHVGLWNAWGIVTSAYLGGQPDWAVVVDEPERQEELARWRAGFAGRHGVAVLATGDVRTGKVTFQNPEVLEGVPIPDRAEFDRVVERTVAELRETGRRVAERAAQRTDAGRIGVPVVHPQFRGPSDPSGEVN